MNIFKSIGNAFKSLGKLIAKGLKLATDAGLTDAVILLALPLVKQASTKYVDNADRREWVVKALMRNKVPEAVARIATELAYKIYKKEVADKLDELGK